MHPNDHLLTYSQFELVKNEIHTNPYAAFDRCNRYAEQHLMEAAHAGATNDAVNNTIAAVKEITRDPNDTPTAWEAEDPNVWFARNYTPAW